MYIILNKLTDKTAVIKEKTEIAGYLNKSISTIRRNLKAKRWETDTFIVIEADFVQVKSNRGGKREAKNQNGMF